jgi:uncharacterized protein (TIGR02145 family)
MRYKINGFVFRRELVIITLAVVLAFCEKPERVLKISAYPPEEGLITYSTATLKGEIIDLGSEPIEEYGIAISKSSAFLNPETKSIPAKATKGIYQVQFTNLDKVTVYYYKAYALVHGDIIYSSERKQFNTKDSQTATVVTDSPSEITVNSALFHGEVISDGGDPVTQRGFCWNAAGAPDITDCIDSTVNGSGKGVFYGLIHGLSEGTEYFVRAYAINAKGVSYNDIDISFHTITKPTVITNPTIATSPSEAAGGGTVTEDGWAEVFERGVCWNTSGDPTTANAKSTDGAGGGSFNSFLTGLLPGTLYYVRAYAANAAGPSYGQNVTFNTKIADIDGNTYNTVTIGTQVWMAENLKTTRFNDGTPIDLVTIDTLWKKMTNPGYCWFNNDGSTYKNLYGALYYLGANTYPDPNWYGSKNLCPVGWRIPNMEDDVYTLTNLFGGQSVAAVQLKEAGTLHWNSPNTGATNESGFTALPGGYRAYDGTFQSFGSVGVWWTNERSTPSSSFRKFSMTSDATELFSYGSGMGCSIRCIKGY